ncbi:MAG: AAA family ATPase [Mycobacterium sp.]
MPKQDRGAPARPPWLPEEDEQRGFLRSLRRKKRNADEDGPDEDSLTRETERPSTPKAPAQKPVAESVTTPAEERTPGMPPEAKANGTTSVSEASKYYTPARKPESSDEQPLIAESNAVAQTPVSRAPLIAVSPIPEMRPAPRPISQVEQPAPIAPSEPPAISVPEAAAAEPPPAPEAVTPPRAEPSPAFETPAEAAAPPALTQEPVRTDEANLPAPTVEPVSDADPFSRFSELEAKLRQMSLDESITDAGLERRRRHAMPEPEAEAPAALSFTPPEAIDDMPKVGAQTPDFALASAPDLTPPEAIDEAPEVEPEVEVVAEEVPQEPPAALTADFVPQVPVVTADVAGDFIPQTSIADEPSEPSAPTDESAAESDDIDARAAALLQRIEAKRAELNEELAAHDALEPETPAAPTPEPDPVHFEPMVAPWATPGPAAEELAETETPTAVETEPEKVQPAPPAIENVVVDEPVVEETPALQVEDVAVSEPELPAAQAVDPVLGGEIGEGEPESVEAPAAPVEPEQSALESVAALESPAEPLAVVEPEPAATGAPESERSSRQPGRRLAPPPWQIPSAMQPAPAVEPPAQQAYYVPTQPQQPGPPQPPMQQPAAQAPPGWNPRQPYPGQWAPQMPQPYGGQQLPSQPPPQPTSVQGQWQWVPQQAQAPQPPPQQGPPPGPPQEPPAGYVPPPQATAPPANYRAPQAYRMPPSLDEAEVINRGRYAPRSGWRKAVHRATSGHVNPGDSRKDRENEQLLASIRQPILGDYRIAVLSIKGGVGKTTTTLGLGSAFATIRTDRIIAVDANPDRGTLAERVRDHSTQSTVRDLLNDQNIRSYADVRNHTRMATSRLEVLASEQDPAVSEAFGGVDYRNTIDILQRYYNIILTDCGTGIMHSAMDGVLDLAHTIVLVSSPAMDSARSASATLDWLMQHGHSGLVREAHVVLSASRPGSAGIKLDKVYEHFAARCRSIHMIPFDPHLAEGADVDFNLLNGDTNEAYLKLAGAISESFPRLRMRGDEQR